ncbi:type II secretion system assembly factor GspB [Aeromonas schubertii]|uniref:General secretion pathway protein GspB n=1 Tax=Aeromonas schubertii TaxID=652 RepID=A0A0S2SE83_9GAMM|nr:type II secretion system assembly factor GspB [Aeromonas schubertii]ALP39954.1 general secretion pathway protein GspB [Aeromonas schubertii]
MSTLLNALRRAETPVGTPHIPAMGLATRPEPTTPRWIWPLLALLALLLGAGANYGWHWLNNKPLEQKVEVTHKVVPPFVRVEPREFDTEPLPPPLPKPEPRVRTPQGSPLPTLPGYDLSGVSPELARRFAQAVGNSQPQAPISEPANTGSGVPSLAALPYEVSQQVPSISYGSHIYSSNPSKRSVILNGRELREGAPLAPGVVIKGIEQDALILQVGGQLASLKALQDWHP